ncbi:MAG TPA: hypothetical protein VJ183_00050, partial [Chloroflexia bacterium]|nr:hypothetical protein [Chloroflexia bacterium]
MDMGDQERQRLAKLQELRAAGIDPYPPRSHRTHTAAEAIAAFEQWEAAQTTDDTPNSALRTPHSALPDPPPPTP